MIDYSHPVFTSRALQEKEWAAHTGYTEPERHNGHDRAAVRTKAVVLVIDDSPAMVEALSDVLSFLNWDVLAALDGDEGLSLFSENGDAISAVILDMNMPTMSGEETLRRLREQDPDIQVIVSSSLSEEEARRRCSAEGEDISHFLPKPYNLDQATELLKAVLNS